MLLYYLALALNSFRRDLAFCILIVVATGLGIGATMTAMTVIHVMSGDPIPQRSGSLYVPHVDPLPIGYRSNQEGIDPSDYMTWPDALAVVGAGVAQHQAAMAGGEAVVYPSVGAHAPFIAEGRYTTSEFFAMFDRPFSKGSGWTRADDDNRSRVVVLAESLAAELTGKIDCVGMSVRLGGADFRVIGVTPDWRPSPLFYADPAAKSFGRGDRFFMPLSTAIDSGMTMTGSSTSWGGAADQTTLLTSPTTTWLQVWVQLSGPQQRAAFMRFLFGYVAQQKQLGRYERPDAGVRIVGLRDDMRQLSLIPSDVSLQFWVSVGFLLICLVNIVGLLLSRFMRRNGEISVRRALGASEGDIFRQFCVESALLGAFGGLLGLLVAQLGLYVVRSRPDEYAHLAQMDIAMLGMTVILAVLSTLLAGLLPALRVCRIQPSLEMKLL